MNGLPLIKLDFFGVNMGFYLNGYKDFRSKFGGIISILIYLITIICGAIFGKELWIKMNPKINTSTLYKSPTKIFYPDNIFFMVSVTSDSMPYVDEKIYRVIGYIKTKINGTEEQFNTRKVSLDICSNVFNQTYKYYDSMKELNLSNYYCISLEKNKKNGIEKDDLFVNEFWGKDGFQMLQIKIYNCTTIAENKNECSSNKVIKQKLESSIVSYYTLKNYIDTNNYKNPYVRGLQETFYYVSYNRYVSATEYLKHVQVHSDIGFLFCEEKINSDNLLTL